MSEAAEHGMRHGDAKKIKDALKRHAIHGGPRLPGGYSEAERIRYREHCNGPHAPKRKE